MGTEPDPRASNGATEEGAGVPAGEDAIIAWLAAAPTLPMPGAVAERLAAVIADEVAARGAIADDPDLLLADDDPLDGDALKGESELWEAVELGSPASPDRDFEI